MVNRDNQFFICDFCGNEFPWDDDCADLDDMIYILMLLCKRCRGEREADDSADADSWKDK